MTPLLSPDVCFGRNRCLRQGNWLIEISDETGGKRFYHRRFQRPATGGQEVSRGVSKVVQRVREFAAATCRLLALNGL